MAGNILSAVINITAPGAQQAFQGVANGATKTEATIKKLTPAVSKLGDSIETLRAKLLARREFLITETDVNKIAIYNREIKALEAEISRVGNIGGSSFGKIGEKAGDAFGVIRKLAFVLPGIGIAGLFDAAFQGISKVIEAIGKVGNKFNEAAVDAEVFRAANEKVGDDAARLQALVSVAKDVSLSTTERKNAIAELQRLYPDYLRNISLENINSAAAAKAIDDLTKSIINKAIAEVFSHKVAEETLKLMDLQAKREEALGKQAKAAAELSARSQTEPINAIKKLRGQYDFITATLVDVNKATNDQQDVVNKLTEKLKLATIAELDFTKTAKPERAKAIKDFDLMAGLLEILRRDAAAIKKEFQSGFDAAAKARLKVSSNIQLDTLGTNFGEQTDKISSNIKREVETLTKNNPILIQAQANIKLTARNEEIAKAIKSIEDIITNTISTGFASFGDALGQALSGGDIGKVFAEFANTLGEAVQSIGKQLITLGIVAQAAKIALTKLFVNPALQIAAGIALVAVGAAIKNLLGSGIKGHAIGGFVAGGQDILVGERGPEIFRPNTGGEIIPNNRLRGSGGGAGAMQVAVAGEFVLRGKDLIATIALAEQFQSRNK